MSLFVNVYTYGKDGNIRILPEPDPSKELAGTEECRQKLWGSDAVKKIGLRLLTSLARRDIYADGDLLDELEREAAIIKNHVLEVTLATGYGEEYILQRLKNILDAIECAKQKKGGVVIS